jgi:hypothetical protein
MRADSSFSFFPPTSPNDVETMSACACDDNVWLGLLPALATKVDGRTYNSEDEVCDVAESVGRSRDFRPTP